MKILKKYVFLTALSLFVCSLAFADGDSRIPTQAEKDFNKMVLNTFAKAVPPGPEGWEKTGDITANADLRVVYSEEKEPLRLECHLAWQDTKRINAAQDQYNQELMKLIKKPGFTEKDMSDLEKKTAPHDVKVKIDFYTNISSQGIYEKVTPAAAIAGGLAYRSQADYRNSSWNEGTVYVFLGNGWKLGSSSSSGTYIDFKPARKLGASTVIQNIVVKIQADSKRAEQIIQTMDWETLKKLIQN
jgi:hypothetical protein